MDDSDEELSSAPAPKLSRTPSWVMLGFLLGALFVWTLPRAEKTVVSPPVVIEREKPAPRPMAAPRMAAVEAIFSEWGRYAVWENDVTEVALWNPEVNRFSDFFEVMRINGNYFFRSIPGFTKPLLTHGVPTEAPMQFTETEAHRQRWLKDVSDENKRAFTDAVRQTFSGTPKSETKESGQPTPEPTPIPPERP